MRARGGAGRSGTELKQERGVRGVRVVVGGGVLRVL